MNSLRRILIILTMLSVFIISSCNPVPYDNLRNNPDQNPSSDQSADVIHINVPDSPESYNDDFLKQMWLFIGGGNSGGFGSFDVFVDISGNDLRIENLPNKEVTLVVYRLNEDINYRSHPVYQFHSDHQFYPDKDGRAILDINLSSSDAFIIVVDGKVIYKSNSGLIDLYLHIGESAYICTKSDRVNLRSQPGYSNEILAKMYPGEIIEVIDGPAECDINNCWWQIETENGVVGWVVDGGDDVDKYYVCPLE